MIDKGGVHPPISGTCRPMRGFKPVECQRARTGSEGNCRKEQTESLAVAAAGPVDLLMLSIDEIKEMVDELFKVEIKKFLKGYK